MKFAKSLVRIISIADKEWIQTRRDPRSLYISMISPIIFTLLFGYALTVDVKNVSMAVYDQDMTSGSRKFLEEFSHTEYLKITKYVNNYREIDSLINHEDIKLGLVIPRNFEKYYKTGKEINIQLIADGSDSTSASVAIGYVKAIVANYNIDTKVKELKKIGITETRVPVEAETRVWYNSELKSKNFIIPSLIVMIMTIISALIASLTISREWERGTMETLISTPLHGFELIFGKLIPYIVIGFFDIIIMILLGKFVFNVNIRGNIVELYLLAFLFLTGTTSMGMMISSAMKAQALSVQVSIIVTFLPTVILSGFIFPIENMPLLIQFVTYFVPAKYAILLIRAIILKGISIVFLWAQIGFLFLFASLAIVVSIRKITLRLPE